MPYANDPLWTLGAAGAVGLVLLAGSLAIATLLGLARWRPRRRGWAALGALAIFWVYLWLSPQIFYLYFLLLIEGLPLQWVARVPGPADTLRSLSFTGSGQISRHAEGVLGWLLFAVSLRSPSRGVGP